MYSQRADARTVVMDAMVVGGADGGMHTALSRTEKVAIDNSRAELGVVRSGHNMERVCIRPAS